MNKPTTKKTTVTSNNQNIVEENIQNPADNSGDIDELKLQIQTYQNQLLELQSLVMRTMDAAIPNKDNTSMDRWCTIIHLEDRAEGLYTIFHSSMMEYRFSFFGETRKVRRAELDDIISKNRKLFERLTMTLGADDSDLIEEYNLPKTEAIALKRNQLANLTNLPIEQLKSIYTKVCDTHKHLIIRKWVTGYYENTDGAYRDINKVNLLNDLSDGALSRIVDDMTEQRKVRRN